MLSNSPSSTLKGSCPLAAELSMRRAPAPLPSPLQAWALQYSACPNHRRPRAQFAMAQREAFDAAARAAAAEAALTRAEAAHRQRLADLERLYGSRRAVAAQLRRPTMDAASPPEGAAFVNCQRCLTAVAWRAAGFCPHLFARLGS